MDLSPHFTIEELTRSQVALRLGLPNDPDATQLANLVRLCETLLEPARALLGVSLHVNSGLRTLVVNKAVGGAQTSQHLDGCAADVVPAGLELQDAFDFLRTSGLPFDQLIFECSAWIHLSVTRHAGETPRRQALTAAGGPGHWTYHEVSRG